MLQTDSIKNLFLHNDFFKCQFFYLFLWGSFLESLVHHLKLLHELSAAILEVFLLREF